MTIDEAVMAYAKARMRTQALWVRYVAKCEDARHATGQERARLDREAGQMYQARGTLATQMRDAHRELDKAILGSS